MSPESEYSIPQRKEIAEFLVIVIGRTEVEKEDAIVQYLNTNYPNLLPEDILKIISDLPSYPEWKLDG